MPFYSGNAFSNYPLQKIEDIFGMEFKNVLITLETGQWTGPINSAFGFTM